MIVSTNATPEISPEWISGATYSANTSKATDPTDHINLVKKPTFSDGLVGMWSNNWYGQIDSVTASKSNSGELRVKDRDNWESGNTFAVTAGETIYASYDVDTANSVDGGVFGLMVLGAGGIVVGWIGVGYLPGVPWYRYSGSITIPPGAVTAKPWIQINDYPWVDPTRHYSSFDNLYLSRGLPGSGSANLVVKSTFVTATYGGWTGSAGTANITAVTNSRGGDGMLTTTHRDTLEVGNNFTVYPGETLHISYDVLTISSSHNGNCGLMVTNSEGTVVGCMGIPHGSGLGWTRLSGSITMPESAAKAIPWIQIDLPSDEEGIASFTNIYICRHARGTMGPFVSRKSVRKVYERITNGISTTAPEYDDTNWAEVRPTNEWAMFDREISTKTIGKSGIIVTIAPGKYVNSIGLFGIIAERVEITVRDGLRGEIIYGNSDLSGPKIKVMDGTLVTDWYQYYYEPLVSLDAFIFTDLPQYINAHITVEAIGTGDVSIGLLDIGSFYDLGGTGYNTTLSLTDYSKKTTDEFGATKLVVRGFAKKLNARAMFDNVQLSRVTSVLAALRSVPCSWCATDIDDLAPLNIFGWYEDMDIDVAYQKASYCTITVQGLLE